MTFEFFTTKLHRARWKQKQTFTFWYCVDNFYPWKDIIGKKVLKLGSIAELRTFYGNLLPKYHYNYLVMDTEIFISMMLKAKKLSYEYIFCDCILSNKTRSLSGLAFSFLSNQIILLKCLLANLIGWTLQPEKNL